MGHVTQAVLLLTSVGIYFYTLLVKLCASSLIMCQVFNETVVYLAF